MPKARATVATKTIKDPDLINIFNQLTGASDPDPLLVVPKYEALMKEMKDVLSILTTMLNSSCPTMFAFQAAGWDEIRSFVNKHDPLDWQLPVWEPWVTATSGAETLEEKLDAASIPKYEPGALCAKFRELKDGPLVKALVKTCSQMIPFKKYLQAKVPKHDFIINDDGLYLKLFSFSSLDFKSLFMSDIMSSNRRAGDYVMTVLGLVYRKCYAIYKIMTSPIIDVDKFATVLVKNLSVVRKQIPRCDDAFNKIESSIGLLKNNFDRYYKDFVQSGNPGVIIEQFVGDVAKSAEADRKITRQFRQIITFYRKKIQSVSPKDNPQIPKIFGMIEENFAVLSKATGAGESSEEEKEDDDGETPPDSPE